VNQRLELTLDKKTFIWVIGKFGFILSFQKAQLSLHDSIAANRADNYLMLFWAKPQKTFSFSKLFIYLIVHKKKIYVVSSLNFI